MLRVSATGDDLDFMHRTESELGNREQLMKRSGWTLLTIPQRKHYETNAEKNDQFGVTAEQPQSAFGGDGLEPCIPHERKAGIPGSEPRYMYEYSSR